MKILKQILTYLFAAFIIFGGVNHFLKPAMYFPFFADFMPKEFLNYAGGAIEIILGICVFIPQFRQKACYGIFILMLVFLPIHIWDIFRENPAIGSHQAALIRVPVQFLFIAWAWYNYKNN
jgi:uncharacterized membrane protein